MTIIIRDLSDGEIEVLCHGHVWRPLAAVQQGRSVLDTLFLKFATGNQARRFLKRNPALREPTVRLLAAHTALVPRGEPVPKNLRANALSGKGVILSVL